MQVEFELVEEKAGEKALIKAVEKTKAIENAIEILEGAEDSIPVSKEGKTYLLKKNAIYYIESVDKKTFIYTKTDCFESKDRLYELEESLGGFFARCSKALIINLKKIKNVNSELGGRMNATLLNDEIIVISRSYVKEIKRRLEI